MKKFFLLFSVFSIFSGFFSSSVLAEEKLFLAKEKNWEEFLNEPLYLEVKEKQQIHPLYLEEFLTEKYFLQIKNSNLSQKNEIVNPFFCPLTKESSFDNFCLISQPFFRLVQKEKVRQFFLKENDLKKYLEILAEKTNSPPIEGRYRLDENNNFIAIQDSQPGLSLEVEENLQFLIKKISSGQISLEKNIPLLTKRLEPTITPSALKDLGIREKIAHGESNFAGSPANRIHNIHTAVEKFNGILLKPAEEFSFINLLGEVNGSTGYKEELVIRDNKTIPEFGGGICQVSTTLFRTALNAGMKITERKNHAYPVQYYAPQGTDATIYIPKPDLKFINDTPGYVLIQASFEGNKLLFDFFGTSDGRQVELEGPTVIEKTSDGKMKILLYQIVKDAQGKEIRKDTFKSFYDNPDKYHEPEYITKPKNWSNKQWEEYLKKRN